MPEFDQHGEEALRSEYSTGHARGWFIEVDGRMVAIAQVTAQTLEAAMVVGVCTDLAWRGRFETLVAHGRIAYAPAVSRPADPANTGWRGATGRIDALLPSLLAAAGADPARTVAFICGNPGMTDSVADTLRVLGLPDEAVRSEAYWVAAGPDAPI